MKFRNYGLQYFFILVLFFYSCKEKENTIPPEIIQKDSMITILADIHIAEARMMQSGPIFRDRTLKSAYLQQVLRKADVDSSRFLKSFDYYSDNPAIFSGMYEQVVVEISKRQAEKK